MNSEGMSQSFRDLPQAIAGMGRGRQLGFVVGAVAVFAALFAAFVYLQAPATVPLYTNLAEPDAAAVVGKLRELKVTYSITDGGSTVRVPNEQAADLRLQLASAGLPNGSGVGVVGMEVFDRSNLGITDFAQKLNYQRGLEGELMRTIGRLSAVDQARVHLVLPQDRLFAAQQRDASASVVLKLKAGAKLTEEQISSVKFLVSRSVEGLKPENVGVVDTAGNTLGKADTADGARDKQASMRVEVQHQRELEIERKVQNLLDQAIGKGRSVVKATVALDWDVVEQKVETFSPGTLQPQTRSQKDTRESFAGQGADAQAAAGGVPGTQANIPTYQAGAAGGAGGGTSSYQKSEVTSNYEVSSDKRAISRAPGELKNVGIAVMIDQAVQNIQAEQLTQAVSAAVGLQPARGDQIAVVTVPFDTTMSANLAKTIEDETAQARQNDLIQMGVKAGGLVVALIGLALLFRMLSASIRPAGGAGVGGVDGAGLLPDGKGGVAALQSPEAIEAQISALMSGDAVELPPHVLASMSPEERAKYEASRVRSRQLSPSERARRREEVRRLAMEQPALIGETLSKWMAVDSAMAGAS